MRRTIVHQRRLRKIIDRIRKNPHSWRQKSWHCGTSHCVAGHCQLDKINSKRKSRGARLIRWWNTNITKLLTPREFGEYSHNNNSCWEISSPFVAGKDWLALTALEAQWLFKADRTFPQIVLFYRLNRIPSPRQQYSMELASPDKLIPEGMQKA